MIITMGLKNIFSRIKDSTLVAFSKSIKGILLFGHDCVEVFLPFTLSFVYLLYRHYFNRVTWDHFQKEDNNEVTLQPAWVRFQT